MHVSIIGGGGTVGSTIAYTLAVRRPALDLTLVDVAVEVAEAHATDIAHARCHRSHPVGRPADADGPTGTVTAAAPGPEAVADADCLVVTASAPRPSGGAERGGRMTFLERNRSIADEIGGWLAPLEPRPMIVVTNPMDRIAYHLWRACGWPRSSIIGYSLSETARLADWFATRYDVDPTEVSCPILGEHGEYIVPAFSRATVAGEPVELSHADRRAALDFVRDAPYDIIQARGPEDSSRWVTAEGVSRLVDRVLLDDLEAPICLSIPLAGEYGYEDVCLSVPIHLGSDGWYDVETWSLDDWERERFDEAFRAVRDSIHG